MKGRSDTPSDELSFIYLVIDVYERHREDLPTCVWEIMRLVYGRRQELEMEKWRL